MDKPNSYVFVFESEKRGLAYLCFTCLKCFTNWLKLIFTINWNKAGLLKQFLIVPFYFRQGMNRTIICLMVGVVETVVEVVSFLGPYLMWTIKEEHLLSPLIFTKGQLTGCRTLSTYIGCILLLLRGHWYHHICSTTNNHLQFQSFQVRLHYS